MLGFTRKERSVLLFLVIAFVAGLVLFVYRERWQPLPELEKPEDFSSQSSGIIGESAVQESTVRKAERAFTINTATRKELIELPGIGPVMAERILDYRERKGGFKHIEELIHVPLLSAR